MIIEGIKIIKHSSGKLLPVPEGSNYLLLEAGAHSFKIAEWLEGMSDDPGRKVIWQVIGTRKNLVIKKMLKTGGEILSLEIAKKLCGVTTFYLEAGVQYQHNGGDKAGLFFRGFAKPLITKSLWTRTKGSTAFEGTLKYGELIWLHADTEGINGDSVIVDIYCNKGGAGNDLLISTYSHIPCKNGEIDLLITDTFAWYAKMMKGPEVSEFMVKITHSRNGEFYVHDNGGSDIHAKYLKIEKKINIETKMELVNFPLKVE